MNKSHFTITIEGRVQGVGFRYYTRNKARALGLKGYVKNECDGTVKIEAEGKQEKLTELVHWCHEGPPSARVTDVRVEDGEIQNFSYFDVKG